MEFMPHSTGTKAVSTDTPSPQKIILLVRKSVYYSNNNNIQVGTADWYKAPGRKSVRHPAGNATRGSEKNYNEMGRLFLQALPSKNNAMTEKTVADLGRKRGRGVGGRRSRNKENDAEPLDLSSESLTRSSTAESSIYANSAEASFYPSGMPHGTTGSVASSVRPPATRKYFRVVWRCSVCEKDCLRAEESTKCNCGHRLDDHNSQKHHRCGVDRCGCARYQYHFSVAGGAGWKCKCGHRNVDHGTRGSNPCKRHKCGCDGYDVKFVCSCNHGWRLHSTHFEEIDPEIAEIIQKYPDPDPPTKNEDSEDAKFQAEVDSLSKWANQQMRLVPRPALPSGLGQPMKSHASLAEEPTP